MSTLQDTRPDRHGIKARPRTTLALSALMAIGLALVILIPTGHRTTRPSTASVAQSAPPAAVTAQTSGLGNCLVNPYISAIACYHAARTAIATTAPSSYFRDPATHKLLRLPAARHRAGHDPANHPRGRIIP
jgi:hypothetical protein